jgi:hypothetical protein
MKYLLTIYVDQSGMANMPSDQGREMTQSYARFGEEGTRAGVILGGEGLQSASTATTVRVRDGERLVTDGPFIETKEALAGYYLIECANLDEAIGWAEKIPGAGHGAVEVRPVMDYEGMEGQARETAANRA